MKFIVIFSSLFVVNLSWAQIERLKGSWISKDNEMISISDTLESNNYLTNQHLLSDNYYLKIFQDTISFQKRYYSSSENYKKLHITKYDMKIIKHNDSILIIMPSGDHSKRFFQKNEPIEFINSNYIKNENFVFEKLIYTSECFGTCPVIDLEISNTREIKLNIKSYPYYRAENLASFSGKLSDMSFKELIRLLIRSKISDLNMNPDPRMLCCDGAIKTLITYHNGERKFIKVMFEPYLIRDLVSFLYQIEKHGDLIKVTEKFDFKE